MSGGLAPYRRYVAIGDSTSEGLDDPDGQGGFRGWANRLAERMARANRGSVLYANLAVRGRVTRQILDEQLSIAVAMRPDVATVVGGMNDLLRPRFAAAQVADDIGTMQAALIACGATVLTFTLPDMTKVLPLMRPLQPRASALNDALRRVSARTGALLVDLAAHPIASDPRLWSVDRLHANSLGHERIGAALAHALGLDASDAPWTAVLPAAPPFDWTRRARTEAEWMRRFFLPWLWRHARGRSSGDGRGPKRPSLAPFPP